MIDCLIKSLSPELFPMLTMLISSGEAGFSGWDLYRFRGVQGTLMIAGGTEHLPIMIEAAQRVHALHPEIYINVVGGGTALGIRKVREGLVDIGNSGRPLADAERKRYRLVSHPLALDGIAVVVHAGNPVTELSREQIANIFSGRIRNWQALGGADAPIMLYGREPGSATKEVFEQQLSAKGAASAPCTGISSAGRMRNIIARDGNGIGYLSVAHLDSSLVKGIIIDGVVPSPQNVQNGTYPVLRTLNMFTVENVSLLPRLFIEYLQSREGAAIIQRAGFLPLTGGDDSAPAMEPGHVVR